MRNHTGKVISTVLRVMLANAASLSAQLPSDSSLPRPDSAATTAAAAGAPVAAYAGIGGLAPGDEVRVSWRGPAAPSFASTGLSYATAEVVDFDGANLLLRRGRRFFTVPLSSVRRLERRIGTKPASAPAMVAGSASGFAAGFLVGYLTGGIQGGSPDVDRFDAGLTTGVLIGAPLGALAAWATSRGGGIYEEIPFRDRITGVIVDPRGGVVVSLRVGR